MRAPMIFGITAALLMFSASAGAVKADLATGTAAPALQKGTWLNGDAVAIGGKVTLVEFWTFGCWNCANVEPYVKQWHAKYAEQGLVVVGVHTPEFDHEKDLGNVKKYLAEKKITHRVLVDNDFATWRAYKNHYWPAMYLIDAKGVIRYIRIGEGAYEQTEAQIRGLLEEARALPKAPAESGAKRDRASGS